MKIDIQPITKINLENVVDFLKKDEKTCITLMSRFIKNGDIEILPSYIKGYAFFSKNEIFGVLTISEGGVVLHHFTKEFLNPENPFFEELRRVIYLILGEYNIYSIIGDFDGTDFLTNIIKTEKSPKIQIPYKLMIFKEPNDKAFFKLPKDFSLKKCTKNDLDALFTLQVAYELVEVLPPGEDFNLDNCRLNLRHNLGIQHIFGIFSKSQNQFVAKAGTNAIGLNWVQIGGVFTSAKYRNLGLACFLVNHISKFMSESKKSVALFVKDSNEPAKKAYIKAGFEPDSKFCICYF